MTLRGADRPAITTDRDRAAHRARGLGTETGDVRASLHRRGGFLARHHARVRSSLSQCPCLTHAACTSQPQERCRPQESRRRMVAGSMARTESGDAATGSIQGSIGEQFRLNSQPWLAASSRTGPTCSGSLTEGKRAAGLASPTGGCRTIAPPSRGLVERGPHERRGAGDPPVLD